MVRFFKCLRAVKEPKRAIWHFLRPIAARVIKNDRVYIKIEWFFLMNYHLNLDNPKTLNEKIQWLKLNNRKPEYTRMVDKYEVKKYINEVLGIGYTINNIGVWNAVDEIPWEQLPQQFVLKCTHDSHGLVICRDKKTLDKDRAISKLKKCLNTNYYLQYREWPYKDVKPRIICEEYKEDSVTGELNDYKFYMFNGKFRLLNITTGRSKGLLQINYFNEGLRPINMEWGYKSSTHIPQMPHSLSEMMEIATLLSKDIPFLRVDFYELDSHPIIGELTFYDGSGFDRIEPYDMDLRLGEMLDVNLNNDNCI